MPKKQIQFRLLVYRKDNLMNTLFRIIGTFAAISLFISACGALPPQTGQAEQVAHAQRDAAFESMLGRPLTDEVVADFIVNNNCSRAAQFLLCKTAGMALWIDSNQIVETLYLYLNNTDGFAPYEGELPFGLKFYDTMEAVEYKLNRHGVGNAGLPDAGATPDRMHYHATYHEAGMTIIYNFPFPDEGATICAVVVTTKKGPR
jgi:hypothetical protein